MYTPYIVLAVMAILLVLLVLTSVRLAQEYQRAVMFRFGRHVGMRGPGLFFILPFGMERSVFVDLRTITVKLDTQETLTRDGVAVKVNAVLWCQAEYPDQTVLTVVDWQQAVRESAETSLRDTIGQSELDELLKHRLTANEALKQLLVAAVTKWGVKVTAVEIKDLDIPEQMQRAIAKEAEAIRERRARIIKADGEMEAAGKLAEAAAIMAATPTALELRRLQTLSEIGAEHNSTIVVSMPTDGSMGNIGTTAAMSRAMVGHSESAPK
jgi:regulator of protease activity HflC (stomatin/prohibitin superfamily)